jgi:hypothetical protein
MLRILYDKRREQLGSIGIETTFTDLKRVYGIISNGGTQ